MRTEYFFVLLVTPHRLKACEGFDDWTFETGIGILARTRKRADIERSAIDAVDGSSTGTGVPWMWVPIRPHK